MEGLEVAESFDAELGNAIDDVDGLDGVAEADVDAGSDGQVDEGGVELQPWSDRGVDPRACRERDLERPSRRSAQHGAVDDTEVGHRRGVEAEVFELA